MSSHSVVQYARYHQLALPQSTPDLLKRLASVSPINSEQTQLHHPSLAPVEDLIPEDKFQLSQAAATYLSDLTIPKPELRWDHVLEDPYRHQKLVVEVPLLRSNHDRDMRWFKRPMDLKKLIHELAADTGPDGLSSVEESQWLVECSAATEAFSTEIHYPRLESSPTAMRRLTVAMTDSCTQRDLDDSYTDEIVRLQSRQLEPFTPMLSPTVHAMGEVALPLVPQLGLEPRSENSSDSDNLMLHLEQTMKKHDQICTSDISDGSPCKVRQVLAEASKTPERRRTPRSISPISQNVQINATGLKLEVPIVLISPSKSQSNNISKDAMNAFFEDFLIFPEEEKDTHVKQLEKDPLRRQLDVYNECELNKIWMSTPSPQDRDLRLPVPHMNEGWQPGARKLSVQKIISGDDLVMSHQDPPRLAQLNWVPMTKNSTKPVLNENLEGSDSVQSYLDIPKIVTRSEELLWKEPGLRLLEPYDSEDEDEELEIDRTLVNSLGANLDRVAGEKHALQDDSCTWTEQSTVSKAIRTRYAPKAPIACEPDRIPKQDFAARHQVSEPMLKAAVGRKTGMEASSRPENGPRLNPFMAGKPDGPNHKSLYMIPDVTGAAPRKFSASGSLAAFLDLRGGQFKKPTLPATGPSPAIDLYSNPTEDASDAIQSSQVSVAAPDEHIEVPSTPSDLISRSSTPVPAIEAILEERVVVMDERLVSQRPLMALINRQEDDLLRVIYRDLHGLAEIILNPTMCVIYTNVQALKQKNLPGQRSNIVNTLHDRIRQASVQFETLFIIVTTNAADIQNHAHAITDFTAFCASFQAIGANVCPIWMAAGGAAPTSRDKASDALTAWTWRLITQHGLRRNDSMSFIDDATLWELFLREAGVNALAAQLMLGMLKKETSVQVSGDCHRVGNGGGGTWGLRKLVSMSRHEREEMFARFVGRKCLRQVDNIVTRTTSTARP